METRVARPAPRAPHGRPCAALLRVELACAAAVLAACSSPAEPAFDLEGFDSIPRVAELDFSSVEPAESWPYWELRFSMGASGADSIVGSGGEVAREDLAPETIEALDGLALPTGFAGGCLPGWCFKFVAAVDPEGAVVTFATRDQLRTFLGPLDALAEAVILLDAHSFYWEAEGQGIRELADGWEAVVLELVRDCDPIQTDRIQVQLTREGALLERRREIWTRLEGACI